MMLETDLRKRTMNNAWIIDSAAIMGKETDESFAFIQTCFHFD